ncbi:Sir2 family NAD+-dependent deacetylase [Marinimicrococcus flavescens]|uniref:NAD-dependent protein deacylase n=1 Tax=Marinimicrococcus flavescens TaxID=3031815 RepID=A0AAP3XRG7_9PROT|nr:NAD-dependent protein deacylase [Marinimicrococcus flavescens]
MAADRIVVLTGAGISAESGLATFRGPGGLWEGHRLEEVATPEAFRRDPGLVHRFYNARRRRLLERDVQPNPAHRALARLEAEWPGEVVLVTQNIDDLHERAGSRRLLHMHGELLRIRCEACGQRRSCREDIDCTDACIACGSAGTLRPDVVWFGEMPHGLERIYEALSGCGLFLAVGTSGQVYPAAGFVEAVRASGAARTIELNLEPSAVSRCFAERRTGPAARTVPALVDELLESAARQG